MALFDPSIDTIENVLAIRRVAFDNLKNGVTVMSWTSADSSANLQWTLPVSEVLIETKNFLQRVDPDTYGPIVKKAKALFV